MDPKIDTCSQVDTRVLFILGLEKVVLWTFSKLFWGYLGRVWAMFLALKGLLKVYFPSPLGSRGSPTKLRLRFPGLFIKRIQNLLTTFVYKFC